MISILLTLFILAFIQARDQPDHIVGGYEVNPAYKYPWMVSLQYDLMHTCGGTLFTPSTIITAAHCNFGFDESWLASLHRHYIDHSDQDQGIDYRVLDRVDHPKHNKYTNGYDISVWKIEDTSINVTINLDINNYSHEENTILKVIGWGKLLSDGEDATVLMEVQVPIYNIINCKSIYRELDTNSQFCAGYFEGGKDSCQNDSGGPIFLVRNNITTLVGIVSWGRGCAERGYPGVYTSTSSTIKFIYETIKSF